MSHHIQSFPLVKRWTLFAALFAFVSLPLKTPAMEAIQGTRSVTTVAKQASPAVVSISVAVTSQDRPMTYGNGRGYQYEDPFDFFQEYFGAPRRQLQPKIQTGQASGFIVSEDGHVLTNAHVVKGADEIAVTLNDGREFRGTVVGADPNTDVAVVKIEGENLPFLTLGNSDQLEVGQWVVAIGNPLGLQTSVTAGIVSAKGRNNLSIANIEDFIQTDAAINRGNSGGPLLSLNGKVIGMNTAIVTNMGTGGYMGIGFAIPSNIIKHIMDQLIQSGSVTRGFMGVSLQQMNHDLAQAFGLKNTDGALVSDIVKGSPAERAGLMQGDVILEYNNKKVTNVAALRNAVSLMEPGSKINLKILRGGRESMIPLTLAEYPGDKRQPQSSQENNLGVNVETLTPDAAMRLGHGDIQGVIVTTVKPGSPAAWAGLQKGTLIVAVNHQEVKNAEEFYQQLSLSEEGSPILLLIKQGEIMHFVSIKTNR